MYKIDLIEKLLEQYKQWTVELEDVTTNIEYNILQKNSSNIFKERVINFSFASFLVYIGMYFLAFLGFSQDGFLLGIFLFIIGWFISSVIKDKFFSKKRDILTISDEEKSLILNLQTIQNKHFNIRNNINQNSIMINFCNYDELKKDFDTIYDELKNFNTKSLSFKYKQNHQNLTQDYKKQIDIFHTIYANK